MLQQVKIELSCGKIEFFQYHFDDHSPKVEPRGLVYYSALGAVGVSESIQTTKSSSLTGGELVQAIPLRSPARLSRGRSALPLNPLLPNFLAGPENRLAAFVCGSRESIVDRGNPLLLVGPSGSGKTALALTLAAAEAEHLEQPKILHLPAVDFARRYAEAVDGDDLDHFRKTVDEANLVLIDDVHLITDKLAAQEELANRLAVRTDAGRITLLTCRRLPTEIRGFRPLLSSRMLPGLTITVALPGEETRRRLITALAAQESLELDEELHDLLASGLPKDLPAGRLAAAVTHIRIWCRNEGCQPNLAAMQSAIDATASRDEPSMAMITQSVARRFKLRTADLKGPTRRQQVVRARALAMFLGRKLTSQSLQQIGDYFGGRDHTTVLHACRKTESLLTDNPELSRTADEVTETLQANS